MTFKFQRPILQKILNIECSSQWRVLKKNQIEPGLWCLQLEHGLWEVVQIVSIPTINTLRDWLAAKVVFISDLKIGTLGKCIYCWASADVLAAATVTPNLYGISAFRKECLFRKNGGSRDLQSLHSSSFRLCQILGDRPHVITPNTGVER